MMIMSEDENEKKKVRYLTPLGGDPPLYIDSEASDEGTLKHASRLRELSNLYWGIIFGLVLGIVGNLFVSHFYGVLSASIRLNQGEVSLIFF
jgi:hypothetical protein